MGSRISSNAPGSAQPGVEDRVARRVRVGALGLGGRLTLPTQARGLVICPRIGGADEAAGRTDASAGPRRGSRPVDFPLVLRQQRLATLLVDLLSKREAQDSRCALDLALLAGRTVETLDWAAGRAELRGLLAGLCADGTAAAAALVAATQRPARVGALVARSGRPDLAGAELARVSVPTLLIVGGADTEAVRINREAMLALTCEKRLEVVPGATRSFAEPGALEAVAHMAAAWFSHRLAGGGVRL